MNVYCRAERIAGDSVGGVYLGRKFTTSEPRWSDETGESGGRGLGCSGCVGELTTASWVRLGGKVTRRGGTGGIFVRSIVGNDGGSDGAS